MNDIIQVTLLCHWDSCRQNFIGNIIQFLFEKYVWILFSFCVCNLIYSKILTANDRIVTKNAQAAQNHCTLQIANDDSSIPASKTITEAGINTLETNKSANATLTINAFPVKLFINL